MPFVQRFTIARRGIHNDRGRIQNKPFGYFVFESPAPGDVGNIGIQITTATGALVAYIPTGVKDTILQSLKYKRDESGCAEATLTLVDIPKFPLIVGSVIKVQYPDGRDYLGYLYKPTVEGTVKNDIHKYEFFGLRRKYKDTKIKTLQNFTISSIVQSGSNTTFNTVESTTGVLTGQRLISSKADNSANNGNWLITVVAANALTVVNPAGVNQAGSNGTLRVLPIEWSSSNLVSEVFKQIVQAYCQDLGIVYNSAKIEASTGSITNGFVDFNGATVQKAIDLLQGLVNGLWTMGVDEDGEFFFTTSETLRDALETGYDLNDFEVNDNFDQIKNSIVVHRTKSRTEGGNGWIVAAISSDPTSVAKYTLQEKVIKVPAFFSDSLAQVYADKELEFLKDNHSSIKAKQMPFKRRYRIGFYRTFTAPDFYTTVEEEFDSLSGFTFGANLNQAIQNTILISGANAFRFNLSAASNGENFFKAYSISTSGKRKLQFWYRADTLGNFFNIEIFDGTNTYTQEVFVDLLNNFQLLEWDISGLTLDTIIQIKFNFHSIASAIELYIDELSIYKYGVKVLTVPFKNVITNIMPHNALLDVEFGQVYSRDLAEFLAGVEAISESSSLVLEDKSQ